MGRSAIFIIAKIVKYVKHFLMKGISDNGKISRDQNY